MPVSQAVANAQVRRFEKNYSQFPDGAGQIALARAFREACFDNEHAIKVGDYLERTLHFAPKPADIYDAVTALRLSDEGRVPEWKGFGCRCETCQDMGWQMTEQGATRCTACSRAKVKTLPPKAGGVVQ